MAMPVVRVVWLCININFICRKRYIVRHNDMEYTNVYNIYSLYLPSHK